MLELRNTSLNSEFSLQLDILADLLQTRGYHVKAYSHPSLPHYSKLTQPQKTQILQALRAYSEALGDVCDASYKFDDNIDMGQFVWRFLLRLGITPSDDLFSTIQNEHFIQIYNLDQFQIFRSLRCFERCSFTLEELTSKSWDQLWERDNLFLYALTGLATKIIQFMKPTKLRLDFPYHTVREVGSECLFDFRYKIKSVSVLTHQKQAQAAVLIEDWKF
jgi:hypothetical protein